MTERQRQVIDLLVQKIANLRQAIDKLYATPTTTADEVDRVEDGVRTAQRELLFAENWLTTLRYTPSPPLPDPAGDQALLDAIQRLGSITAGTAALGSLLDALHGLVTAFKEPAPAAAPAMTLMARISSSNRIEAAPRELAFAPAMAGELEVAGLAPIAADAAPAGPVVASVPRDSAKQYLENFAKLIPAEALVAYTSLTGIIEGAGGSGIAGLEHGVVVTGWLCLLLAVAARVLTSFDPSGATRKPQFLPGLAAGVAFAVWLYANGQTLGGDLGLDEASRKFWGAFIAAAWVAFSPVFVPLAVRMLAKPQEA